MTEGKYARKKKTRSYKNNNLLLWDYSSVLSLHKRTETEYFTLVDRYIRRFSFIGCPDITLTTVVSHLCSSINTISSNYRRLYVLLKFGPQKSIKSVLDSLGTMMNYLEALKSSDLSINNLALFIDHCIVCWFRTKRLIRASTEFVQYKLDQLSEKQELNKFTM